MSWDETIEVGTRVVVRHPTFDEEPLYEGIVIAVTDSFYCVRKKNTGIFGAVTPESEEWLKKDRLEALK